MTTHVNEEDTGADGLDDPDEIERRTVRFGWGFKYTCFDVRKNPDDADSDHDGVGDYDQGNGYRYPVFNDTVTVDGKIHSGPLRWRIDGRYNDFADIDPAPGTRHRRRRALLRPGGQVAHHGPRVRIDRRSRPERRPVRRLPGRDDRDRV